MICRATRNETRSLLGQFSVCGMLTAGLMVGPAVAKPPVPTVPVMAAAAGAAAALLSCSEHNEHVSVMVMDADTSPRVLLRGDGAPAFTADIARRKAYTVIKTGLSSHDFALTLPPAQRIMPPPGYQGPFPPPGPIRSDPELDPSDGGLPIRQGSTLRGAISVSGAANGAADAACARAGLAAAMRTPAQGSAPGASASTQTRQDP